MTLWLPLHQRPSVFHFSKKKRFDDNIDRSIYPPVFLKTPITKKLHGKNIATNGLEIGHSSIQGYRVSMEDEYIIDGFVEAKDHTIVAIMDGHAGKDAAKYTALHLKQKIEDTEFWQQYVSLSTKDRKKQFELLGSALVQAYVDIDQDMLELTEKSLMDSSGCTAVCAIITPSHIVCANVGDSRCVIGSKTEIVAMTEDHKPENPEETERIEKAGGHVVFNRVNGELAMSRALGDFRYKQSPELSMSEQLVICVPDISFHERKKGDDQLMVLACDGVWDVISNDEAVTFLAGVLYDDVDVAENSDDRKGKSNKKKSAETEPASSHSTEEAAEILIDTALDQGSTDNISAIVVKFL